MSSLSLDLQSFYPKELKITDVEETETEIVIHMHSVSKTCKCYKCGSELTVHHGSHHRSVQDLPILGKRVRLECQIYDYQCSCGENGSFAPTETFDGFLSYYSRMTNRLEDFLCILALETSCNACSRIMKAMNVKVSRDTIIRLLIKRYSSQPEPVVGSVIGIDDFAFKKRGSYGTIIVDEKTHKPVAVLEGRDGTALKEWLRQNQHVTTVTRDRASAYAKAVEEVLPDCMQVADRFHLHQNLMEAVKKILGREIPAAIVIPTEDLEANSADTLPESSTPLAEGKKNRCRCG